MYETIKSSLDRLQKIPEFIKLIKEYRYSFGIPEEGFKTSDNEDYKNWIKETTRKHTLLADQFMFLAKRFKNIAPTQDPIPLAVIANYILFNTLPNEGPKNIKQFSIEPSGILGSFDLLYSVPFRFSLEEFEEQINKSKEAVKTLINNRDKCLSAFESKRESLIEYNTKLDLLSTTPGNGNDIIDRVHRDIAYLVEFGRIILRNQLDRMKDSDFTVHKYEDKNKHIVAPIQQMGMSLLNRGLYPILELYWQHMDDEIEQFNARKCRKINRGISLANTGVAQLAQGKVIEGLFNIYRAYQNDKDSLQHLPNIIIDPEKDMAQSILYTQFETRLLSDIYKIVSSTTNASVYNITKTTLKDFVNKIGADKKILFYLIIYRFVFSSDLNTKLPNPINRNEIIRSLSEITLWFEDELKRKNPSLSGKTLVPILGVKIGQHLNPKGHNFTSVKNLTELETKITNSINSGSATEFTNARILAAMRNFAGHNIDTSNHRFFNMVPDVFSRILNFIIYSRTQNWI